jgi:hypothetical protein
MISRYGGPRPLHRSTCRTVATNYGGESCPYLPGEAIETFVSGWGLRALEPAALPVSLAATARVEQERQALDPLGQQRLERAAYERERAACPDRWVEPEPRLVARQRAQEWDEKLTQQRQLQEESQRFLQPPLKSSPARRETPSRHWRTRFSPFGGLRRRPWPTGKRGGDSSSRASLWRAKVSVSGFR